MRIVFAAALNHKDGTEEGKILLQLTYQAKASTVVNDMPRQWPGALALISHECLFFFLSCLSTVNTSVLQGLHGCSVALLTLSRSATIG